MGINTFIFDCFGVFSPPPVSLWYQKHSLKNGFVDENFSKLLEDFDLNKMSEDGLCEHFSNYEGIEMSKEDILKEIDSYLALDMKLINTVLRLKEKGFKIALLSNANAAFFERLFYKQHPEFKNLFDAVIISSDVGMIKPSKEIYLYTLGKINSKAEECLLIDDTQKNLDGAEQLGIRGFLYTEPDSFSVYLKDLGID